MIKEFYLPILKSKLGEFHALAKLDVHTRKQIVPLFEITPLEFDQTTGKKPKTLEEHLQNFCKKLTKYWGFATALIDTNLLGDEEVSGSTCVEYVFDRLGMHALSTLPVVWLNASPKLLNSIKGMTSKYSLEEVVLRVTVEDVTSITFERE